MSNYLTYPFKTMNLTQSYSVGNHLPHNSGSPKDYPIDEAGADTGREYFYCPCDGMKITKLYGNVAVGYHIWLESTAKVDMANGKSDYVTILAVHMNTDDYVKLKVGQTFKRGQAIFREGTTGKATGNHCHYAVGSGKGSAANYWKQNSKGSWVLVTDGQPLKPEQAFYVDKSFTTVKNAAGLKFKDKPAAVTSAKVYKTTLDVLNMRVGIGTSKSILLTVPKGKQVEVLSQDVGSANGYTWSRIRYNSKNGYVASKYLLSLKKTTDILNMRVGIGTSKSILLTIPKNKQVEVLSQNAGSANGYVWSKIKYSGKTGYVASKYLK